MAKRKPVLGEVKNPVASVQLNKHCRTNIYAVDAGEGFRLPDKGSKEQWCCGPSLVIEEVKGEERNYHCYCIGDSLPWEWICGLISVGQWALLDKRVAPLLPPEFVAMSPRFNGTTQKQRERGRDTLPKPKPKPKRKEGKHT